MLNEPGQGGRRIAVTLDLTWALRRHFDVFAGVARYAAERADWACVVDDFAEDTLGEHGGRGRGAGRGLPYHGVIARVTPGLARVARQRKLPIVNTWLSTPVRDVPSVVPDSAAAGRLLADHLIDRGIRQTICLIRRGDVSERRSAQSVAALMGAADGACQIVAVSQKFARNRERWRQTRAVLEEWIRKSPLPVGV